MERRLITTDCHIAPPYSLVDQLPERYREHFPRLDRRTDGTYLVQPRSALMAAMMMEVDSGGVKIADDPVSLARTAVNNVCAEATPSLDPVEQLADLERDGVYGAVLISRIHAFDPATPPDVDIAYCQVVNDWLAETWGPHLDRAAPGFVLPYRDVGASVKEFERAAGMGLRPALLPEAVHDRPYHLAEWEPLWEIAHGLKVPFTMHVGSSASVNPPQQEGQQFSVFPGIADVSWYSLCCSMGVTLGHLTYNGMFEKYPDLHVVMTEGYAGWFGFMIQFLDHHWSDSRLHSLSIGNTPGSAKIDAPPSVYLKRQAHATFMWDPIAIRNRDITGIDSLLWGNDYPHMEGAYPFSQEWVDKQFAGVPEDEIDMMVRGNAARLFGITI
jgi:predicted TIM-barrel fold metal-dependent hydrolase